MFLLVPAYPGSPKPKAVKCLCAVRAYVRACVRACMLHACCMHDIVCVRFMYTVKR